MRLGCLLAVFASAASCSADLALVPYPREVTPLPEGPSLARLETLSVPEGVAEGAVEALLAAIERECGAPPRLSWAPAGTERVVLGSWRGGPGVLPPSSERGEEAYSLRCDGSGVTLAARTAEGLTRGLATLTQLVSANARRGRLPGVAIEDWPALRWRIFQDDLTRGPSSRPEYLAREVALGSTLKLNAFTWYMESQYVFPRHPELAPPDGALTREELRDLVREGERHGVGILGNQQSFAHMERILWRPELAGIAETPYLLTPACEETYQFLDDLYSGMLPELPFPPFNVCCDETVGLGSGPTREWAEREGVGAVYVAHVKRLRQLVTEKYGKRMMMWGDIILTHPERLGSIPRDVVMLTWAYDARDSFASQIRPFTDSGFEFLVCPGASNWSRILPDFATAARNIEVFTRDGARNGALGMLNTTWDDDGLTLDPTVWHAFAWGAECAWGGSATSLEDFERRLGAVLFGEREGRFARVMARLRALPVRWGGDLYSEPALPILAIPSAGSGDAEARASELRGILADLADCRAHARDNADLLDYLAHGVERMLLIEERTIASEANADAWRRAMRGDEQPATAVASVLARQRALREAHAASRAEFVRLWDAINRPYAREWSTDRYDALLASYDRSIATLEAAAGGHSLPSAEEVGVGVSALPSPRLSPTAVAGALPLAARWEAAEATWRLPLRIHAAAEATGLLPVEADLALPEGVSAGPVRAFLAGSEIPAQLEPAAEGTARLTLVIPRGERPQGGMLLTLYGGGATEAPPWAATARVDGSGAWLANDRVRFSIGAEGAHLYRWEVTALGDRDVTLAGEGGYAGFSDVNTWRSASHTLAVTSKGPAVARCYAVGPGGVLKSVSLYAGAGWVEVTLSRPTGYYWDFEDPALFSPESAGGCYLFDGGGEGPAPWPPGVIASQVAVGGARWVAKRAASGLLLGLVTPGARGTLTVGPGEGAGGVGLQRGEGASRFVTFCDVSAGEPTALLTELAETLDPARLPLVEVGEAERR